jgi:hypothetical protein
MREHVVPHYFDMFKKMCRYHNRLFFTEILFLNTGGLSDPYFTIRKAFGPGYTPPNKDSQGRDAKPYYEGKHKDPPFLKSEYITKDLNPSWKTCAIDLERCGIGLVVNNNKTSLKYSKLVPIPQEFACTNSPQKLECSPRILRQGRNSCT